MSYTWVQCYPNWQKGEEYVEIRGETEIPFFLGKWIWIWNIPEVNGFIGNRWYYHDWVWKGRSQKAQSFTRKDGARINTCITEITTWAVKHLVKLFMCCAVSKLPGTRNVNPVHAIHLKTSCSPFHLFTGVDSCAFFSAYLHQEEGHSVRLQGPGELHILHFCLDLCHLSAVCMVLHKGDYSRLHLLILITTCVEHMFHYFL